jgi:PilZ domain
VPSKPRLLELVLDAYREGDLHECIRLVRTLVEAAPQATAPRQLLAALFAETGNGRQALAHYRRLLPQAVTRGEVIRAIAFQKQIDVYDHDDALAPGRWLALQKQLRERGLPFLPETPGGVDRPWVEAHLLGLPRAWFERIAAETRFEILGLEPRSLDVESGTVWEVLAGRVRWSFALPDGRASAEALAAEGDVVHVDPGLSPTARVSLVPELPVEALRFDAGLARDLRLALSAGLHLTTSRLTGLSHETRLMLPTRPMRQDDMDEPVRVPVGSGVEPLKLPPPAETPAEPPPAPPDSGDWVEFGVLSLSEPVPSENGDATAPATDESSAEQPQPIESSAADAAGRSGDDAAVPLAADATVPAELPVAPETSESEPAVALPPLFDQLPGAPGQPPAAPRDPALSAPRGPEPEDEIPVDPAEGLLAVPSADPAASGDQEQLVERRRHPRVTVTLESRMALLRLSGSLLPPIEGQLGDMSTSGFSLRFPNEALGAAHAALTDAVVAVDLELSGPNGSLRLAAQVRWLEMDAAPGEARVGIEFVLLTEPDRKRIAGTLAKAALALHAASRKAA